MINVGSVDFSPYIRLLLTSVGGARLADQLIVITDGDPPQADNPSLTRDPEPVPGPAADCEQGAGPDAPQDDAADDEPAAYNRASELRALGDVLGAGDALHIAEAPHTLEADLLVPGSDNHVALGRALLLQRPRSARQWQAITASPDPAQAMYVKLRATRGWISKGQFAHDVAALISGGENFTCPAYLEAAVRQVTAGPIR